MCFVAIVWRKRCVKSASREYCGAAIGSGSRHINGNGCYREWDRSPASHTRIMAARSENHEMDYFVAAVTTNIPCENNSDHLDTKVVHTLFILHYLAWSMDFMFLESTLCFILHMLYQFDQIFFENKVKFSCNMCLCFLYTHMYIFGGGWEGYGFKLSMNWIFVVVLSTFVWKYKGKNYFQ